MSISVILRPNAIGAGVSGEWVTTGASDPWTAWGDNSDSSYVTKTGVAGSLWVNIGTFSLPAGAATKSLSVSIRGYDSSGNPGQTKALCQGASVQVTTLDSTVRTYTSADSSWYGTQSNIDNLLLSVYVQGSSLARVHDSWVTLKYNPKPNAPTGIGPTGTVNNTLTPTIVWTHDATHEAQYSRHVKIFTNAVYTGGGFNVDSSQAVFNSQLDTSTQQVTSTSLTNGTTYWVFVKTAINSVGVYQWSDWSTAVSFTTTTDVEVPNTVTPAQGSTVATARPPLDAKGPLEIAPQTKRQWQIASNSGFTTNAQTIDEEIFRLNHDSAGPFAFPIAAASLAQGLWYLRARFYDTEANAWSGAQTFTVQHIPSAACVSPIGSVTKQYATTVQLDWSFSDPYSGDNQTAYQIELWKTADKAGSLINVAKTASTATIATVGTLNSTWKNISLSWRVKVWDVDDVASDWSETATFFLRDLPVATITAPTNGGTVTVPAPTITWTYSSTGGLAQSGWRVIVTNEDADIVVADSGPRTGANLSWTLPDPLIKLGINYSVKVDLTDSVGQVGTATTWFYALYVAPTAPTLIVNSTYFDNDSYVYLDWSSSTVDGSNSGWRIYRRIIGEVNWTLVYDGGQIPSVKSYSDYLAPSNYNVEYGAVQVNSSFDGLIESDKTLVTVDLTGLGGEYVLIVPDLPSLNTILYYVKTDDFSEEFEQSVVNLVDRGRRMEFGARKGQGGSLSAELRDVGSLTAREQRETIEQIRDCGCDVYLRTPFGEVWKVALPSATFDRVAGMGQRGYATVSFDYVEVTA